jgi:hypothetical protein
MKLRSSTLVSFGAVALALLACKKSGGGAVAGATGKYTGTYNIASGQNPGGGSSYSGTVAITQSEQSYQVVWTLADGNTFRGIAVEAGNVLGVGWAGEGVKGVIVYQINGGELDGRWTTSDMGGKLGTEKLSGSGALSGTYQIVDSHSPQTGGSYEGSAVITPNGPTHSVQWTLKSGESYSGVGIREGNQFVVGWGPGVSVVAYTDSGGKLNGKWAAPGGTALGSETLAKK